MDNLEDYYLCVQNYKIGKYEYETITSTDDVKKAIEKGKKFVFLGTGAKIAFIIGLIFLLIGTLFAIILYNIMEIVLTFDLIIIVVSLIPFLIFAIPGFIFIILGFLTLRTHFIVLGPEGIVYKLKVGSIKGFNWEDINMDFVEKSSEMEIKAINSFLIYISMPNGDFLEFGRNDYTLKEFGGNQADILMLLTFMNYYNYRKRGSFDPPNY